MRSTAFRQAAQDRDLNRTIAQLSTAVVLRSPVAPEPLRGRGAVRRLFAILYEVWDELEFIGPAYVADDGAEVLHFRWRIGAHEAEGVDMLRFDEAGLIVDYRVMIRPLPALEELRDRGVCPAVFVIGFSAEAAALEGLHRGAPVIGYGDRALLLVVV